MIDQNQKVVKSAQISQEDSLKKKQISQLLRLFQKNGVIKNQAAVNFVEEMFGELPSSLVDDVYDMYNEAELLKLKNKNK